ncbi:DUF4345 family protein [Phaeodactylibacter sp.]|jgi:hypothetical protein|uniref:DUF4345 family protein n=1 Tax=Phaeodactylibacter sp. TaxID=1940289 RepID=UPI0025D61202|nr:DUF4345 family protein [Phaeodactylibacter sp.]MCI5090912.1 DUF4345 domain-containing protein [Phaeodactylibacter sp.]
MLLFIRVFLILYGLIAIGTGVHAMTGPYDPAIEPMADNSHRFIAAIWASTALGFFYCVWDPSEVMLFRFLMIALFIGGIVRAAALIHYSPTPVIWAVILLELVPTPILWYMHSKLLITGALN